MYAQIRCLSRARFFTRTPVPLDGPDMNWALVRVRCNCELRLDSRVPIDMARSAILCRHGDRRHHTTGAQAKMTVPIFPPLTMYQRGGMRSSSLFAQSLLVHDGHRLPPRCARIRDVRRDGWGLSII